MNSRVGSAGRGGGASGTSTAFGTTVTPRERPRRRSPWRSVSEHTKVSRDRATAARSAAKTAGTWARENSLPGRNGGCRAARSFIRCSTSSMSNATARSRRPVLRNAHIAGSRWTNTRSGPRSKAWTKAAACRSPDGPKNFSCRDAAKMPLMWWLRMVSSRSRHATGVAETGKPQYAVWDRFSSTGSGWASATRRGTKCRTSTRSATAPTAPMSTRRRL